DRPLDEWASKVDDWLGELLRIEGRMGFTDDCCPSCGTGAAEYRCSDCFNNRLYCGECTAQAHRDHPLHRLEACAFTSLHA
ncbi:hypothetical protein FOMPIDRAFT_49903, partial [Fomitopsis schrenkii]